MSQEDRSLLSRSTRGASILISLQIGSRALTFIVNQVLLRFLSPELLGISSQLELYAITVLTFARESLRISLGRQSGTVAAIAPPSEDTRTEKPKTRSKSKKPDEKSNGAAEAPAAVAYAFSPAIRAQEAINLSYLAPALSPLLAIFFGWLYLSRASEKALSIPYLVPSVYVYGFSAVLELLSEPCFAVAAQQGLYGVRARAETTATVGRCLVACGLAAWGARTGQKFGALPFAAGQLSYALGLNGVYWFSILPRSSEGGYSLLPRPLASIKASSAVDASRYISGLLAKPVLVLCGTLYLQSILKHFLTQGDSFLISIFASLASQGMYALASNYGSLLARMLFQPIEESSRGVFGSLLGASSTSTTKKWTPPKENIDAAKQYLSNVLRLYSLLSLGIAALGPTMAPLLLRLVAGKSWSDSEAGEVLGFYCYYIPLLSFNGILEAFVAATADPAELGRQSVWMTGFSAVFATAGYVTLKVYDMGAIGLVAANIVNMLNRIIFSWSFVAAYFKRNQSRFGSNDISPKVEVTAAALAAVAALNWVKTTFTGSFFDLVQSAAVAAAFGAAVLFFERHFLLDCYRLLRPGASSGKSVSSDEKKEL